MKFEYKAERVEAKDYAELSKMLTGFGQDGWELFYVDIGRTIGQVLANCVFKREGEVAPVRRGPGRPPKAA